MRQKRTYEPVFVIFAIMAVLWPVLGHSQTEEEIYAWTLKQMGLDKQIEMPVIRYVDRSELKEVFKRNNRNAYLRWESEYGPDQAEKILKLYLDEIIGLFDIHTDIIYVGSFLYSCRRQAILAHEMTHYLQIRKQGPQPAGWVDMGTLHATREMEAYKVEEIFTRTFCADESPIEQSTAGNQ